MGSSAKEAILWWLNGVAGAWLGRFEFPRSRGDEVGIMLSIHHHFPSKADRAVVGVARLGGHSVEPRGYGAEQNRIRLLPAPISRNVPQGARDGELHVPLKLHGCRDDDLPKR